MIASNPEYHILGNRVAVNRLRLGTIITSIRNLTRLNAGQEPDIEPDRLDFWHDTDVEVIRDIGLLGGADMELKIASIGAGVGSAIKMDRKHHNMEKFKFAAIDTLEFDSVKDDHMEAGQAQGVQQFLEGSGHHPVFYITGIKVGRVAADTGSTFERTQVTKLGGTLSLGADFATGSRIGPRVGGSKAIEVNQKYNETSDRIFAVRVKKLRYKKTRMLGLLGPRDWVGEPYNAGAELVGEDDDRDGEEEPEPAFDDVEVIDLDIQDLKGFIKLSDIDVRGVPVTWVVPEGW